MIKALTFDPKTGKLEEVEYKDYKDIQKFVGGCFDVSRLEVEGVNFDCYVHDEGLLLQLEPSIFYRGKTHLVGPVFITKSNNQGQSISLTDKDISIIKNSPKIEAQITYKDGNFKKEGFVLYL